MNQFDLPALPYGYDLLEPVVSAETLKFHHDKHHRAYVDKLNELLPGSGFEGHSLQDIVLHAEGPLFNQAGQHWNHIFYWYSMIPKGKSIGPNGTFLKAMQNAFGSFEDFKKAFEKKATEQFGSGWAWLVCDDSGHLQIVTTANAENPLRDHLYPLFVCDVWEHAYYIDYRNGRAKYLSQFWSILNWEFAQANYLKAFQRHTQYQPHISV